MVKQILKVISDRDTAPAAELSDDDLMCLVALGRRDAFEALVTRHQALVLGLAIRYLGDRQAGRDVAQDVFLALWAERQRYRPRGMFRSYLTSVCINRCRVISRGWRNQGRKVADLAREVPSQSATARDIPLDALLEMERQQEILRHLTRVPEKTRLVLIYRFTNEMSLEEIAKTSGMRLGTVKSHLSRGIARIRRMMRKDM